MNACTVISLDWVHAWLPNDHYSNALTIPVVWFAAGGVPVMHQDGVAIANYAALIIVLEGISSDSTTYPERSFHQPIFRLSYMFASSNTIG